MSRRDSRGSGGNWKGCRLFLALENRLEAAFLCKGTVQLLDRHEMVKAEGGRVMLGCVAFPSAILYLNGDFDGGNFYFTELDAKTMTVSASLFLFLELMSSA